MVQAQQRCQSPVFQKAAVEAMKQQQWRTLTENSNREGCVNAEFRKFPPFQLVDQSSRFRIQEVGFERCTVTKTVVKSRRVTELAQNVCALS